MPKPKNGRNHTRIDGKAFAAHQAGRDARLDNPLEHATTNRSGTMAPSRAATFNMIHGARWGLHIPAHHVRSWILKSRRALIQNAVAENSTQ
jgi:hypothetical protein